MRPSDTSEGSVWCCPVLGLLCCRRDPMGAGLSQTQDGALVASQATQPITMAEVVRERKRKMNGGLATLRRRLLAGRRGARGPRSSDPAAPLRDLLREWSPIEVGALLEEYEALAALRDLCVQAELARPPAAALRGDLATLYDHRICPDAELIFKGSCFPVHRAILSARCPYFRELLNGYPSVGARVCLDSPLPPQVDTAALDGLLRFLYAGEPAPQPCDGESCDPSNRRRQAASSVPDCCPNLNDAQRSQHGRLTLDVVSANGTAQRHARGPEPAMLRRLAQELGAQPAALHRDMRHLLDTAEFADASLVFTWEPPAPPPAAPPVPEGQQPAQQNSWDYGFRPRLELPCHRAVLSARSPFFRSVIQRRCRQQANESSSTVKIVLDERVIPHKYARVLLHAVYTDQVDLNLVMRGGGSIFGCSILGSHGSSLGEAQALTGNQQSASACARSNSSGNVATHAPSPLEEAMELYEIGRFLELDILSQGCEDIIAERLSASSLAAVLKWSSQPHGSRWVHRQALRYLREEFLSVAAGPALLQLEAAHLQHALRCPFLQASELDALRAALRWGEHRLVKRMEDREPNLLSHTAHSVTRKGVKKRDLSDTELRELLADTLPLVRTDHVLPPNSELLTQAIRRGLVSSPPSCMLGDAPVSRADAWIRGKGNGGVYIRPRLYMPYYEEVKALLEDQMVQETELVRMRRARYIPDIPDTLYMVSAEPRARSSASVAAAESPRGAPGAAAAAAAPLAPAAPPAPSPQLLRALLSREAELRRAPACVRATSRALTHTHEVNRQIRLRVVREFNLPDSVADTLEGAVVEGGASTPQQHAARSSQDGDDTDVELDEIGNRRCLQNSRDGLEPWCASPVGGRRPLPALLTEGDKSRPLSVESVVTRQRRRQIQNGRGLSEVMPDVAMATSSLTRLRIGQSEATCRKTEPPEGFRYAEDPAKDIDNALQSSYHTSGAVSYSLGRDERKQPPQNVAVTPQSGLNLNMFHSREATSYADCAAPYAADISPCVSGDRQIYTCDGRSPCVDGRGIYDRAVYSSFVADGRMNPLNPLYPDNRQYGMAYSLNTKDRPSDPVVPFMNPNQHLLQEGCGFGAYGRPNRESRRRNHAWNSAQNQGEPASSYQHSDMETVPALQLDLGDGNQHSSPARHAEGSQSWVRNQPHDRSGTLPADYGHSQYAVGCHPSPSTQARHCASYSRYLSASAGAATGNTVTGQAGGASAGSSAGAGTPGVATSNNSVYGVNPATNVGITAASNPMYGMNPTGFSTLQHHGRSRSPRAPPGHATLQRPRPVCPLTKSQPAERDAFAAFPAGQPQCGTKTAPCTVQPGGSLARMKSADCTASVSSCAAGNVGNCRPSNTGGSVAGTPSSSGEREAGVHRSHSAGSVASIGSDVERRDTKSAVHNVSGFNHQLPFSSVPETTPSPRHFRSLYSLPDPPYGRSPREYYASLRMSPFQESLQYSRVESPFACIQQQQQQPAQRPGSCSGIVDTLQANSRGESPLYTAINSSSRGSSPFRALDSTPTQQFTRTSSPYSSGHRSEYRLSENYTQNLQRSSSPGCRAYPAATNQRNSPSLKQQTANARLSASPSSACLQNKSRNSPIPNFSQSSLKLQRSSGDQKVQQKTCEGQKVADSAPKGPRVVTSSPSCSSVNSFSRQDSSSRPPSREKEYFKQYQSTNAAPRYL